MTSFPILPILDEMRQRLPTTTVSVLGDVMIVCVQHLLETTGSLFETLVHLGARPERIYVLGKLYSTNVDVSHKLRKMGVQVQENTIPRKRGGFARVLNQDVKALWKTVYREAVQYPIKSIVVLDDGGHCLSSIPEEIWKRWPVVGIEQTTSGLLQRDLPGAFPIIGVASSAAKQQIEPPMISTAIFRKLRSLISLDGGNTMCGVIGLGNIGRAIARDLVRLGHRVFVFDRKSSLARSVPGAIWCDGIEKVLSQAECIFGCTGEDSVIDVVERGEWLNSVKGNKTLVSCSSEDKEFLSLLKFFNREGLDQNFDPLQTVTCRLPRGTITILRGGFPVNFDGTPESVPAMDIQMTRALLLGGILQAALCDRSRDQSADRWEMLEPEIQKFIVNRWLELRPSRARWYFHDTLEGFKKLKWIQQQSFGNELSSEGLRKVFGY